MSTIFSRFLKKLDGDIFVKDRAIDKWRDLDYAKILSIVLTEKASDTHLLVNDLIELGRYPYTNFMGKLGSPDKKIVDQAIELLGISHLLSKKVDELSDGQRQKVFIARALAQDTNILLLDEPTTFLDLPGKLEILGILKKIAIEKKVAVLFSSHDWQLILELASWIWLIDQKGGMKAGVPEDFIINGDFEKCFHHPQFVFDDEIGIFKDVFKDLKLKEGDAIEILHMNRPASLTFIKKKLDGGNLKSDEVNTIVKEIMDGKLSDIETSAWISAAYIRGFSDEVVIALTHATVNSGEKLELGKGPICDKHCIGGVAGNRTTMVLVPIVACTDLYIPKTSSRSITSPSGTADTF